MEQSVVESVEQISRSVTILSIAVQDLTERQSRQIIRTKWMALIAIAGLILDITLTAGGVGLILESRAHSIQLSEQQEDLEQLQADSLSVVGACTFYSAFMNAWNPGSDLAKADPIRYEDAFDRLEGEAYALGCAHHTRGPRR